MRLSVILLGRYGEGAGGQCAHDEVKPDLGKCADVEYLRLICHFAAALKKNLLVVVGSVITNVSPTFVGLSQ
jgi:hypothetical protein